MTDTTTAPVETIKNPATGIDLIILAELLVALAIVLAAVLA